MKNTALLYKRGWFEPMIFHQHSLGYQLLRACQYLYNQCRCLPFGYLVGTLRHQQLFSTFVSRLSPIGILWRQSFMINAENLVSSQRTSWLFCVSVCLPKPLCRATRPATILEAKPPAESVSQNSVRLELNLPLQLPPWTFNVAGV